MNAVRRSSDNNCYSYTNSSNLTFKPHYFMFPLKDTNRLEQQDDYYSQIVERQRQHSLHQINTDLRQDDSDFFFCRRIPVPFLDEELAKRKNSGINYATPPTKDSSGNTKSTPHQKTVLIQEKEAKKVHLNIKTNDEQEVVPLHQFQKGTEKKENLPKSNSKQNNQRPIHNLLKNSSPDQQGQQQGSSNQRNETLFYSNSQAYSPIKNDQMTSTSKLSLSEIHSFNISASNRHFQSQSKYGKSAISSAKKYPQKNSEDKFVNITPLSHNYIKNTTHFNSFNEEQAEQSNPEKILVTKEYIEEMNLKAREGEAAQRVIEIQEERIQNLQYQLLQTKKQLQENEKLNQSLLERLKEHKENSFDAIKFRNELKMELNQSIQLQEQNLIKIKQEVQPLLEKEANLLRQEIQPLLEKEAKLGTKGSPLKQFMKKEEEKSKVEDEDEEEGNNFKMKVCKALNFQKDEDIFKEIKSLVQYKNQNQLFTERLKETLVLLAPEGYFKENKPSLLASWRFIKATLQDYVAMKTEKNRLNQLVMHLQGVIALQK